MIYYQKCVLQSCCSHCISVYAHTKRLFRLGQKVQKDEWHTRLVQTFKCGNVLPPTVVIAAGSTASAGKSSRKATC